MVQRPCRSGSPHGVLGAGLVFAAAPAFPVVGWAWHPTVAMISDTTVIVAPTPINWSNRSLISYPISHPRDWRVSYVFSLPFIDLLTRRDLARDVHDDGVALPVFDQLLLAKMSIQELFDKLLA